MMSENPDYEIHPFPVLRRAIIDPLRIGSKQRTVYGLVEVDITGVRQWLRDYKARTGETLSLTAFVIRCVGRAVGEYRIMHACRNWRNQIILFEEVDVTTIIEVELENQKFPLAYIIRAANRKSFSDIHQEIRAVQNNPEKGLSGIKRLKLIKWTMYMPAFVRLLFYRIILRNPRMMKEHIGTVMVTAFGMFGKGGGWGITPSLFNFHLAVGGIKERLLLIDGRPAQRELLCLTLGFNHDIIDGAPAARFTSRLKELIESGEELR